MKFTNSYLLSGKLIESLDKQLKEKGEEINGYMEKHNIQLGDQQVGLQNTNTYVPLRNENSKRGILTLSSEQQYAM